MLAGTGKAAWYGQLPFGLAEWRQNLRLGKTEVCDSIGRKEEVTKTNKNGRNAVVSDV